MMQEFESGYEDYSRLGGEALPTPLSKIDPHAYRDHSLNYREFNYQQNISLSSELESVRFVKKKCSCNDDIDI